MTSEKRPSFPAERLAVSTLTERPELRAQLFSAEFAAAVPEFLHHDPTAELYYADGALDRYLDFALAAVDRDEPDRVIARAVSALEIMVLPPYRGRGLAQSMLAALCANTRARGFADLYAPLRPSDKHKEPRVPFADYVARTRSDGLPHDSWVRVHLRAGAQVVKIAPRSMVIAGSLAEWSGWTGMNFARGANVIVPGALSPVHVSREQDHAVYVEPNLWVHHRV